MFELNTRLFPQSANACDSLAHAYLKRDQPGDVQRGIEYLHRTLAVIPEDRSREGDFLKGLQEDAEKWLEQLQGAAENQGEGE